MEVEKNRRTTSQTAETREVLAHFLAARGGPFYEAQKHLKLLKEHSLSSGRRALLFVIVAWGIPFLLGLPASLSLQSGTYLADPGVWARFFVAVAAFVLADQQVERGLRVKLTQFVRAPIIAPTCFEAAGSAVARALAQRNSATAEMVCLLLAAAVSVTSYFNFKAVEAPFWAVDVLAGGNVITAPGWWSIFVSLPLFIFLFLRGIWRHLVWSLLLRRIAKLELRLVATHPDGRGGLAFLAEYPNAYALFVFGTSSAIAAAIVKHLIHDTLTITTFSAILGAWLIIVIAFFAYPLSAFSGPLAKLKERSLLALGAQGTRFHRSVERATVGMNVVADSAEEAETQGGESPDPTKQFEVVRKMSSMLVNRAAIVPVAAATLLPFVVVGIQRLPLKEVVSVVKKLLLL